MKLHEALKAAAAVCAADLDLPLGWEGEVFTTPAGPYLKGRIVYEGERAATLGAHGATRTDGVLEFTVAVLAGTSEAESAVMSLARAVGRFFPRGRGVDCDGGEAVFTVPAVADTRTDGARIFAEARCPFYAILDGENV